MKRLISIAGAVAALSLAAAGALQLWHPGGLRAAVDTGTNHTPSAPTGLHKCTQGGRVTYSSSPCAPGQQAQAIQGGAMTVVEGQRPKPALPTAAASLPNARDLVGDPNQPTLRDQYIDRVVNN